MTNIIFKATVNLKSEKYSTPSVQISVSRNQKLHYVMALKGRCHIYETAFDSKVEKRNEESGDLIDRIANHPILQLLHIRRRSKPSNIYSSPQKNLQSGSSSEKDQKTQVRACVSLTPKGARHSRFPARSVSSNQLSVQQQQQQQYQQQRQQQQEQKPYQHHQGLSRPIGLSKSDDEILSRGGATSESPEEEDEDFLDDYREGPHAQDLANDLHSLHVTTHSSSFATNKDVVHRLRTDGGLNTSTTPLPPSTISISSVQQQQYSSAHGRPRDKSSHHNSTRPFTKFCSRVQPQKSLNEPRVHLLQGEMSKSQLLPLKKSLQPLKLHSPPGTAPLPVKFSKKTPIMEQNPSSWFSPPVRQKELKLPIKKSFEKGSANSSSSSLNDSMVVLLDAGSRRDLKDCCLLPPAVSVKYSSVDSVVTGSAMSSMESLRSSMSDGSKSSSSDSAAHMSSGSSGSYSRSRHSGSESSLPTAASTRPFLNLGNAPHRSLIQSAKFQILSPISDKSQEPSLETGGLSQTTSPQDLLGLATTSHTPRNIQDDFRNVHHILPRPNPPPPPPPPPVRVGGGGNGAGGGQPGSDSGISIEYKNQGSLTPPPPPQQQQQQQQQQQKSVTSKPPEIPFGDLPFDMPKLRRRLALAKASLSSSNSSISSSAPSSEANARLSLPPQAAFNVNQPTSSLHLNPAISRLQVSSMGGGVSGTSSSNSSEWDARSSGESSDGGSSGTAAVAAGVVGPQTAFSFKQGRKSLALELGCSAMSAKGQEVDVNLPLTKQNWYHGVINRQEAESILRNHAEGSYIVRAIRSSKWDYSLALKSARGFMHFRMRYDHANCGYTIGRSPDQLFPSVPHIVSHFSVYRIPIKGAEHMVLLHPIPSETL